MKNRYLYRRETLTGLSFMQTMDEGLEAATRPRILLMSLLRGGGTAGDAAETVVARNVEYEKGLSLPALVGGDRLLVTFVNGATAQLAGADVIAHAQGPKEERLSAVVVGGGLAGSLIFTTTLVKQGPLVEGPTSPRGAAAAVALLGHAARALLLQPEHAVPLLAAGGLLAAAVASLTDRRQQVCLSSFQQACGELRFGTMVFVAVSLLVHVLLSLLLRVKAERGEGKAQAAEQGAALAGTIYLEVGRAGVGVCGVLPSYLESSHGLTCSSTSQTTRPPGRGLPRRGAAGGGWRGRRSGGRGRAVANPATLHRRLPGRHGRGRPALAALGGVAAAVRDGRDPGAGAPVLQADQGVLPPLLLRRGPRREP